jgi:hypothetical protein
MTRFEFLKITPMCISIETVKVAFFLSGVEVVQVLEVEVSIGGPTKSNVKSFEAFITIYLSITRNKYSIIFY